MWILPCGSLLWGRGNYWLHRWVAQCLIWQGPCLRTFSCVLEEERTMMTFDMESCILKIKMFFYSFLSYFSLLVPQGKRNCIDSSSSTGKCYGDVCKRHIKHFLNDRPYKIFRQRGGIPKNFRHRVRQAMSFEKAYHPITFNCWHFALKLLRTGGKRCHFEIQYMSRGHTHQNL